MPVTTALAHKALKTVEVTRDNIMSMQVYSPPRSSWSVTDAPYGRNCYGRSLAREYYLVFPNQGRMSPWTDPVKVIAVDWTGPVTTGYAESQRTFWLYRWVQTGRAGATKSNMTKVRIIPAKDTGDLAGTLRFDPKDGFPGFVADELGLDF